MFADDSLLLLEVKCEASALSTRAVVWGRGSPVPLVLAAVGTFALLIFTTSAVLGIIDSGAVPMYVTIPALTGGLLIIGGLNYRDHRAEKGAA